MHIINLQHRKPVNTLWTWEWKIMVLFMHIQRVRMVDLTKVTFLVQRSLNLQRMKNYCSECVIIILALQSIHWQQKRLNTRRWVQRSRVNLADLPQEMLSIISLLLQKLDNMLWTWNRKIMFLFLCIQKVRMVVSAITFLAQRSLNLQRMKSLYSECVMMIIPVLQHIHWQQRRLNTRH